MAHVAQMLTQEPIYKSSSVFCLKPILLSAHKLILLIYGDNTPPLARLAFGPVTKGTYCPGPKGNRDKWPETKTCSVVVYILKKWY